MGYRLRHNRATPIRDEGREIERKFDCEDEFSKPGEILTSPRPLMGEVRVSSEIGHPSSLKRAPASCGCMADASALTNVVICAKVYL